MTEITPYELSKTPFEMIGKDWALVTAELDGKTNMMTVSWGGMGILWNKPVAFVFIRPQRFTKHLVDGADKFSLSFYDEKYRDALTYCGRISGANEDKIKGSGLSLTDIEGVPSFAQADITIICKKLYAQDLKEDCFTDNSLVGANYPTADFHTMYIAEIEKIIKRD